MADETTRLFALSGDGLPQSAELLWFASDEGMNRLFRFEVTFALPAADGLALDLDATTGTGATITVNDDGGSPKHAYHGIVERIELVDDLQAFSVFRLWLVPKLWSLGLGEHSRVFVAETLPDILGAVLKDGGLATSDYELRLNASYPAIPHVCQYRESRLAFLTRWLERVGGYYYFEHSTSATKLVIADDTTTHAACRGEALRYHPSRESDASAGECVRAFRWQTDVLAKKVKARDYNYEKPSLDVSGEADVVPNDKGGEHAHFSVNEATPDRAKVFAQARAGEFLATRDRFRGEARAFGLVPGLTFDLDEHPRSDLCKKYLLTRVHQQGFESGSSARIGVGRADYERGHRGAHAEAREVLRVEFEAVDATVKWQPPTVTTWPCIAGTVRARVDGEATSDYAQLDDDGRYVVHVLFDESGLADGKASMRVRMLQSHAGNPEGLHLPLRKDTEVQIAFVHGDPDQPVIAGAIPNKVTTTPVTQANRSQNVFQTGGKNRIEMEDKQGAEYIDISSPPQDTFAHMGAHAGLGSHNFVFSTAGDYLMHTGGNRDVTVDAKQTEDVTGDVTEDYHATQTTHVSGSLTETIDGGGTETIHAGAKQTIDGGRNQTINAGETRTVNGGETETLNGGRTQTINGSSTETITGALDQTISGGGNVTTLGGFTLLAAGGIDLSTPAKVNITANGGYNLLAPAGQKRLDSLYDGTGEESFFIAPNKLSLVKNRIDIRLALHFQIGAVRINLFGVKRSMSPKQISTAGLVLATGGLYSSTKAYSKWTAGLIGMGF